MAGTLCPNPVLPDGTRLDTVLGSGFAFITARRPSAFQCAALEDRGAVVHVAEPDSELERWMRRGHATAAIIRPDRTVMRSGRDLSVLTEAVPRFNVADQREETKQ